MYRPIFATLNWTWPSDEDGEAVGRAAPEGPAEPGAGVCLISSIYNLAQLRALDDSH